ncbi:MAG: pyruvate kinase, partial [Dehalococcoidia bacterium]|nr:pyruvate kinase [Dehalococcoidia bacterium]
GDVLCCQVVNGGLLESNKGVNLPGAPLDIPAFTDKDAADLEFGLGLGVDWIALSFVRHAEDVRPLRAAVERHGTRTPILAKIERPEALVNLHGILRAFDGVMVARGDLGIELPPEEVPGWQKTIIQQARNTGKVSIVATQMLESMIGNPRPTRAEVSDVANAVLDGADAVMLSGETSVGSYPTECVTLMAHIIEETQSICSPCETGEKERTSSAGAVAHAACVLARDLRCRALIVLTRSGMTAHSVSMRRPTIPVVAFTDRPAMARQLALWWGITPLVLDFPVHTDDAFRRMEEALLQAGEIKPGDHVVVVGSTPLTVRGPTNFLKVHKIGHGK